MVPVTLLISLVVSLISYHPFLFYTSIIIGSIIGFLFILFQLRDREGGLTSIIIVVFDRFSSQVLFGSLCGHHDWASVGEIV